jgi:hypothetical protein
MKPLRRPFADWVDDRVIPAFRYFGDDHPWISIAAISAASFAFRALLSGSWGLFALSSGVALVPVIWLAIGWDIRRRELRIERMRENHICLHCGYDMRASPERCSECGRWADEPLES